MGKIEGMVKMFVENDCDISIKILFSEMCRFGLIDTIEIRHFCYITKGWHRDGEYVFDADGNEVFRVSDRVWFNQYRKYGTSCINLCLCHAQDVVGWA